MSQDSVHPSHFSRRKCPGCGLVNSSSDEICRRCGTTLSDDDYVEPTHVQEVQPKLPKKRSFRSRVVWILTTTTILLIIFYSSLLLTSDRLNAEQRAKVEAAITLIKSSGLTKEAFVLDHLASFRATDNWLNAYVGHRDAYAATNFPFEVVTLYPEFFEVPVDDRERAAVLLHEARHLLGDGEDAALQNTWQRKRQLGWTADKYGQTRVWDATVRLTKATFPYMFQCGGGGDQDCF